jgi:hypothetical protein
VRALAHFNELAVLRAVNHYGYLRRAQIAAAVWRTSPPRSAYVMASRTCGKLLAKKWLCERPDALGGTAMVLAAEGVRKLREDGEAARDGYDLAVGGPQFFHRTLGTCYLIDRAHSECAVYGEHALQTRRAPVDKSFLAARHKKLPDGIIVRSGREDGLRAGLFSVDWVEVESVYKPYDEIVRVFELVVDQAKTLLNEEGSLVLQQVIFIVDGRSGHPRRLLAYAKRFAATLPATLQSEFLSHVRVAVCDISTPFAWRGCTTLNLAQLDLKLAGLTTTAPRSLPESVVPLHDHQIDRDGPAIDEPAVPDF